MLVTTCPNPSATFTIPHVHFEKTCTLSWLTVCVKRLYMRLVRPTMEFAGAVWDSCSKKDLDILECSQLAVARAILRFSRCHFTNSAVLCAIEWPTLAWHRRRAKLLMLWRLVHGLGPPSLQACLLPSITARSPYCLRNSQSIAFPLCSSAHRLKSFLPSAIAVWNTPPSLALLAQLGALSSNH